MSTPILLAIDVGLKTGLAFYGEDGKLISYRSQNFGSRARLKKGAASLLRQHRGLTHLVIEGSGTLADVWKQAGVRADLRMHVLSAKVWREQLLFSREQRNGASAKHHSDAIARAIISWSGAPTPKGPLRHDTAEAICVGLWGVLEAGLLEEIPSKLRR